MATAHHHRSISEDGSVVSELTQETKYTMPLLSPLTPTTPNSINDHHHRHTTSQSSNHRDQERRPLAAAPMLGEEESDSQAMMGSASMNYDEEDDSFYQLQSLSSQNNDGRSSLPSHSTLNTASLPPSQSADIIQQPERIKQKQSSSSYRTKGLHHPRENSTSTGGSSSLWQSLGSLNPKSQSNHSSITGMYGLRTQPIRESDEEDEEETNSKQNILAPKKDTDAKHPSPKALSPKLDEAGYRSEDESFVSSKSQKRRASRRMSTGDTNHKQSSSSSSSFRHKTTKRDAQKEKHSSGSRQRRRASTGYSGTTKESHRRSKDDFLPGPSSLSVKNQEKSKKKSVSSRKQRRRHSTKSESCLDKDESVTQSRPKSKSKKKKSDSKSSRNNKKMSKSESSTKKASRRASTGYIGIGPTDPKTVPERRGSLGAFDAPSLNRARSAESNGKTGNSNITRTYRPNPDLLHSSESPTSPRLLPPNLSLGDNAFDYLPQKMQRRASTGAMPRKMIEENPRDPILDLDIDMSPVHSHALGPSKTASRRASTGHMNSGDLNYGQAFFPPTPPTKSQKMGRRRSADNVSSDSKYISVRNHNRKVAEEILNQDHGSLTEDDSLEDSSENEEGPDKSQTPKGSSTLSPKRKPLSPTRLAAQRMSGGRMDVGLGRKAEEQDTVSERNIESDSEPLILDEDDPNTGVLSESEYSLNSRRVMRRRSLQNSLVYDPLEASFGQEHGTPLCPGEEEYLLELDDTESPSLEDFQKGDPSASFPHGALSINVDLQEKEKDSEILDEAKACSEPDTGKGDIKAPNRAIPFTTPHPSLTKDALVKIELAGIPVEQPVGINKISMHGNWGEFGIQSSCDSSSENDQSEFGETLYQENPTMDLFDQYKQRPRRRESIDRSMVNMDKDANSKDAEIVPDFRPASGYSNASDYIVRCFMARLRLGVIVLKHNKSRWSKSTPRKLVLMADGRTLSWNPLEGDDDKGRRPMLDLTKCKEVRHALTRDPDTRKQRGTVVLRKKCKNEESARKSFSLIFAKRTLDVTCYTSDGCKVLLEGFSALCFRLQQEKMKDDQDIDLNGAEAHSHVGTDDDWVSTVYGDTTASMTQSYAFSGDHHEAHPWGL